MLHCYEAFVIISQQDISVVWKAEGQETPVELMFVCLALSHGPSALRYDQISHSLIGH